jgi:tRNA (mo5U34)-methyltransferase
MNLDLDEKLAAGGSSDAARAAIAANPVWYHTIELAPGVTTPGQIDLRGEAGRVLPDELSSQRALDVGAFDGFWSFEMERRGAEVIALDLDRLEAAEWSPLQRQRLESVAASWGVELGRGFKLAAEALGSSVSRVVSNVYDLTPEAIGGPVDFAFSGAILLHLRDPVKALERIRDALRPGGVVRVMEPVSVALSLRAPRRPAASFQAADTDFNWWVPNLAGVAAWLRAAQFERIRRVSIVRPPSERRMRQVLATFEATAPGA